MSRWRPFVLLAAAGLNAVAVVVSIWWGPVIVVLPSGAFEGVGGILASLVQHERPGIGPSPAVTTAAVSLIALSGVAGSDWRMLE